MTELTAQGIFDDSVRRLAGMKRRATSLPTYDSPPKCMYRSPQGPCLVGALLTDEEAKPNGIPLDDLPESSVGRLADRGLLPDRLVPHAYLLQRLQGAHDDQCLWLGDGNGPNPEMMAYKLRIIAADCDLNNAVIREVWPHLNP